MQKTEISCVQFLIAGKDAPKMLDFVDEALDEMPLFVEVSIIRNCARPIGVGRDHRRDVALCQVGAKPVRVESFVAKEVLGRQTGDQRLGLGGLVHLAGGVEQTQHIAEGINGDVDLRAQSSARSADRATPPARS